MEKKIELKRASADNVDELTAICVRAFHSDHILPDYPGPEPSGPPGYNSSEWHADIMKKSYYFGLYCEEKLIGGAIVFKERFNICFLGQIYIDPVYQGKGCGGDVMKALFRQFPEAVSWKLETPVWNIRTRAFYKKCGFQEVSVKGDSVWFEKKRQDL